MLQTTVIDMEWNTKWDWENLDIFSSKAVAITSPKKLQSTDWEINEKEETDNSFNLSGIVENNSSTKSSITESSLKNNMKVSNFSFEDSRTFHDTHKKEKEFAGSEPNGSPPSFEASVCSPDQSIGLKLGKRTYFENNFVKNNTKTSSSPNVPTVKKAKLSHQSTPVTRCQVEGCNLDLSSSKEYHRKHKVCEIHSKSLKVVVAGLERRFCQQCSRFHGLPEFDGKKRSCRRRLSDHNARRRKPQQETIQFNSTTLSSSFYGGQQQLSFVLNNVPLAQTKPTVWETRSNCQHSVIPTEKTGLQFPNFNRVLPSKAGVFDQGSNAEALDLRRALSLLSNGSWGSCESDFSGLDQPIHTNGPTMAHQPDYWQLNHHSVDHATGFQESNHVLKPPYGIQYVNPMDEFLKPL